jgi:hypothetical protein
LSIEGPGLSGAFVFQASRSSVLRMRKVDMSAVAAKKPQLPAAERERASIQLVCLALSLALVTLACRIYSVW